MTIGINATKRQKAQAASRPGVPAAPGQINMIGEGTLLEGTLKAKGDVRVSGKIVGKLEVAGKAIVAQEGTIDGELHAESADVAGTIEGEIRVSERVILKNTARVEGDVYAGRLVVEEGATFAGKCIMNAPSGARTVVTSLKENGNGVNKG